MLKQAAESFATAHDGPDLGVWRCVWRREEEKIAFTLMIAFAMIVLYEFAQRQS